MHLSIRKLHLTTYFPVVPYVKLSVSGVPTFKYIRVLWMDGYNEEPTSFLRVHDKTTPFPLKA